MNLSKLKPSTAKLYAMLPEKFALRIDSLDGHALGADVRLADGSASKLDASYPGFAVCLDRLIKAGLVIDAGATIEKAHSPSNHDLLRVTRFFLCLRPTTTTPKGDSTT